MSLVHTLMELVFSTGPCLLTEGAPALAQGSHVMQAKRAMDKDTSSPAAWCL